MDEYTYYRVGRTNSGVYAYGFDDIHDQIRDIIELAGDGVLIVDDLETAANIFNVSVDDIKIVNG